MTAVTTESRAPLNLRIPAEREQNIAWGIVIGLLGACFVAGLYYAGAEMHWWPLVAAADGHYTLKRWWDSGMGFIHAQSWDLYRHGLRNYLEPALFVMAGKTLMARAKYWGVRVPAWRLLATPVAVVVLAVGMALGAVWLTYFGFPAAWHALFGSYILPGTAWLGKFSVAQLAFGVVIGFVLHPLWAPVGATLQGFAVDRSVDRARLTGRIPLWVTHDVAPPVIRRRFEYLWETDEETAQVGRSRKWLITLLSVAIGVITILGILAKFVFARHIGIPYLYNPNV